MGKTCLKLLLTGIILFTVGVAGLAALELNGYDVDDVGVIPDIGSRHTYAINEAVVVETGAYEDGNNIVINDIPQNVTKLDFNVKAGSFYIVGGDEFSVAGYNLNPSYLNCTVNDDCLYVSYSPEVRLFSLDLINLDEASINVTVPAKLLESADFTVKAGNLNVDTINTKNLSLNMSAGTSSFANVSVLERSQIKMTAGDCTFECCNFNNSNSINMTAGDMIYHECSLIGDSNIKMTAGDLFMDLNGRRSDYDIKVDRTAGDIYIGGYDYSEEYNVTTMVTTRIYPELEAYAEEHADSVHEEHEVTVHEEHVKNDLNVKITAGICSITFNENE